MKAGVRGARMVWRHNFNWLCVNGLCCQCHLWCYNESWFSLLFFPWCWYGKMSILRFTKMHMYACICVHIIIYLWYTNVEVGLWCDAKCLPLKSDRLRVGVQKSTSPKKLGVRMHTMISSRFHKRGTWEFCTLGTIQHDILMLIYC